MSLINYKVFGPSGANHAPGLVPDPGVTAQTGANKRFLDEQGSWSIPAAGGAAPTSQGEQDALTPYALRVTTKSVNGNATLTANDGVVFIDASGGSLTVTLPSAADLYNSSKGASKQLVLKRVDTVNVNTVTIAAAAGQTIEGEASVTVPLSGEMTRGSRTIVASSNTACWLI